MRKHFYIHKSSFATVRHVCFGKVVWFRYSVDKDLSFRAHRE